MKPLSIRAGMGSVALLGLVSTAWAGDLVFTSTSFPFSTGIGAAGIGAADFDGDGDVDLAVGNRFTGAASNNRLAIWDNDGSGTMAVLAMLPLPSQPTDVVTGDLDQDGHPDVLVANFVPGNSFSVYRNDGSGGFGPRADKDVLAIPTAVALGDLDGDGDLDVAVCLRSIVDHHVGVAFNDGTGLFPGAVVRYPIGNSPSDVAVADVDGDGALDLVATSRNSNSVSVLLNLGGGSFAPQVSYGVGSAPESVAIADLNGDGHPDLAVANDMSAFVSFLFNDGAGGFGSGSSETVPLTSLDVALADFDGDHDPDAAVAVSFGAEVRLLANDGAGTVVPAGSAATDFDCNALAVADLDGDGDLDLATSNQGIGGSASITVLLNATALTFCQADLGFGGPGTAQLEVCGGDLSGGNDATMTLSRAPKLAPAILVVSLQSNPVFVPAAGGVLVPVPVLFTVPATTDGNGEVSLPVPGGGGPISVYTQWAIVDGPGWALSNAVRLDILP